MYSSLRERAGYEQKTLRSVKTETNSGQVLEVVVMMGGHHEPFGIFVDPITHKTKQVEFCTSCGSPLCNPSRHEVEIVAQDYERVLWTNRGVLRVTGDFDLEKCRNGR
jgi:hypothetical protein